MTAEQVLNHLLPALAFGGARGIEVDVEHYESPYWQTLAHDNAAAQTAEAGLEIRG